jgi:hypothetical protein
MEHSIITSVFLLIFAKDKEHKKLYTFTLKYFIQNIFKHSEAQWWIYRSS